MLAKDKYAVCQSCPLFRAMTKTCKSCGCFMPAKVLLHGQHCPEGKW